MSVTAPVVFPVVMSALRPRFPRVSGSEPYTSATACKEPAERVAPEGRVIEHPLQLRPRGDDSGAAAAPLPRGPRTRSLPDGDEPTRRAGGAAGVLTARH